MKGHSVSRHILAVLLAVCATTMIATQADAKGKACQQIRAACTKAGFVEGAGPQGNGLMVNCVSPILNGTSQPRNATKSLPSVDPQLVTDCKFENPKFAGPDAEAAASAPPEQPSSPLPPGSRPNIVFFLVDDYSINLMTQHMPNLEAMQRDGMTFANYFVTDSLCCPSRSSIFTGMLPHNTGVFTNTPPDGGFGAFMAHGDDGHTFALALHEAGYKTAMLGKYLNGYEPKLNGVPKGWSEWDVDGDQGYGEINYPLNQNGTVVWYNGPLQTNPKNYLTYVVSRLGQAFIEKSAPGPFFIEIATFAPHAPYIPAPADAAKFPALTYDRAAPFGQDMSKDPTAPDWLQNIPPLSPADKDNIDNAFRMRVRDDQAIDEMIGEVRALLVKLHIEKNTYIVFSSDNGYHMGEFNLMPGKMTPLDTDIHVPLVIVGPGVPQGRIANEIVENIDLCPTFTEIGGASAPTSPDGHSLLGLLHPLRNAVPIVWRHEALIEHHHPGPNPSDPDLPEPRSGNPAAYEALRTPDALYVEYSDTEKESGFYDLKTDPIEQHNIIATIPPATLKRWHDVLHANATCKGAQQCWEAQHLAP